MQTRDQTNQQPRGGDDTQRSPARQRVLDGIITALQNGVRPWVQPWSSDTALALPLRVNGAAYRGANILALWAAARARGFAARHWMTFNHAKALGGVVRKGERATRVLFYASATFEEADATTTKEACTRRAVSRAYAVFCADQIDGLPAEFYTPPPRAVDRDEAAMRAMFERTGATVIHGGARACYDPVRDVIHMPPRDAFASSAQFFATYLHELGHWTGHASRLDRGLQPRASATAYGAEELTAELTSAFLGAELGLPVDHIEDHAAYIDHWLKLLDREPGALLGAAARAQRAADFLRAKFNITPGKEAMHCSEPEG